MSIDFLPVVAVGVITMLMSVTLRDIKREYSIILSVVGAVLLMIWGISIMEPISERASELMELSRINTEYSEILLKALGISMCTKLGKDVCCDAGESAIGSKVEFCGRVCLILLAFPLFEELLLLAREIVLG